MWRLGSHLWRLTTTVGRDLCDLSSRRIRWGLCVRVCVSSSLNTQPHNQTYNCYSSWNWSTKSLSSPSLLVLFLQLFHFLISVVVCLFISVWRFLTEDFLNFLSSISSVYPSSSSVIMCLRFLYSVLVFISSWWLWLCSVMFTSEYLFRCKYFFS